MNLDKKYQLLSAVGAFLLWTFWASAVNWSSSDRALYSGVSQGLLSAGLTVLMVRILQYLHPKFKTSLTKLLAPAFVLLVINTVLGVTLHHFIKTSDIFLTLAPALAVGFVFSLVTCNQMNRSLIRENY